MIAAIEIIPLCECGCGEAVSWNKQANRWNRFIRGHNNRGKYFSKEHKRKISESMPDRSGENSTWFGKKHSEETKRKISESMPDRSGEKGPMFGKKHSEKSKRKMSENNSMKRPEVAAKISLIQSSENNPMKRPKVVAKISGKNNHMFGKFGSKNPAWKGGISCEPYCEIWQDKEYKESIKERDNHTCQNPDCWENCNHLPLHIHHINYIKKDCIPKNLLTLCCSCNMRANTNREYWQEFYEEIIEQKYLKEAA